MNKPFQCSVCGEQSPDPYAGHATLPPDTTWRCFRCETDHPHPRSGHWPQGARLLECPQCGARQIDEAPVYVAQKGRPRKNTKWVERDCYCVNCGHCWPHPTNPGEWVSTLPERQWLVDDVGGAARAAEVLGVPPRTIERYLAGKLDLTPEQVDKLGNCAGEDAPESDEEGSDAPEDLGRAGGLPR